MEQMKVLKYIQIMNFWNLILKILQQIIFNLTKMEIVLRFLNQKKFFLLPIKMNVIKKNIISHIILNQKKKKRN